MLPNIVISSEGGTVLCASARFDGGGVMRQLSQSESRRRTPENIYILLPPHALGSGEIYANSIMHSPNGRFVNIMSSESILFEQGGLAWYACAEREGKLKIRPTYWSSSEKEG